MSLFKLRRRLLTSTGGGGGGTSLIYDTRWGTATDASGWIKFGLKPGATQRWVDSINGDDTHNGLTAATAKKTINSIWPDFIGGSPGDQLMIAGTGGRTYSDGTNSTITILASTTAAPVYPTAILSYDPANPADSTKYGKLVGPDVPVITLDSTVGGMFNVVNIEGRGYCAFQGLEVKATSALAYQTPGINWSTNNHPGMIVQNCRFNGTGIATNPGTGANTSTTNTQNGGLISKSSMWNSFGFFCDSTDSFWIQDFIVAHCGWNIGATRDDPVINGGAQVFTHNFYYHATNTRGRFDRIVTVDSALEGLGIRGDVAGSQIIVSIDNVCGIGPGGFSNAGNYAVEAPNGVNCFLDDVVCMGGDYCAPGHPGAFGIQNNNTIPGSYIRNCAMFDNPARTDGNVITQGNPNLNSYVANTRNNAGQAIQALLCDKWSGWDYAQIAETDTGTDMANASVSWSNSVMELLPAGNGSGTVTNTTTRAVAPAGYKTRAQTYAALGFSSKAAMVNAALYRPDLRWAQAIASISLPAMGLTPSFGTVSPPDMTGITPAVIYPTSLGNLSLSTLSFAHATPKAAFITGTSAYSKLSSSDLPTGFSLTATRIDQDGGGTSITCSTVSGSNQLTGVTYTTGIQPGMLVSLYDTTNFNALIVPAGTVVLSVSGSTITMSANANVTVSGAAVVNFETGGRVLSYNGTGTAGTPTFHVTETSKDTLGTHTTAFTLSIS